MELGRRYAFGHRIGHLTVDAGAVWPVLAGYRDSYPVRFAHTIPQHPERPALEIRPEKRCEIEDCERQRPEDVEWLPSNQNTPAVAYSLRVTEYDGYALIRVSDTDESRTIRLPPAYALGVIAWTLQNSLSPAELKWVVQEVYPHNRFPVRVERFETDARLVLTPEQFISILQLLVKSPALTCQTAQAPNKWLASATLGWWAGRRVESPARFDQLFERLVSINTPVPTRKWRVFAQELVAPDEPLAFGLETPIHIKQDVFGAQPWHEVLPSRALVVLAALYQQADREEDIAELFEQIPDERDDYQSAKQAAFDADTITRGEQLAQLLPLAVKQHDHEFRYILANAYYWVGENARHVALGEVANLLYERAADTMIDVGIHDFSWRARLRAAYTRGLVWHLEHERAKAEQAFRSAIDVAHDMERVTGYSDRTILTAAGKAALSTWRRCLADDLDCGTGEQRILSDLHTAFRNATAADDGRFVDVVNRILGAWAGVLSLADATDPSGTLAARELGTDVRTAAADRFDALEAEDQIFHLDSKLSALRCE